MLGLARIGADLAICGRDLESTEAATGELSASGGGPVEVYDCGRHRKHPRRRPSGRDRRPSPTGT
jgi:hypothetical protein